MKIVISGGWGYRNLGDDAILDATIFQLKKAFPGCMCIVLTYDVDDSVVHAADGVHVRHGVHKYSDMGGCEIFCQSIMNDYSVAKKIALKINFSASESRSWFNYFSSHKDCLDVKNEISSADIFIMSGGGYFNEKWLNKTRAQLLELNFAANANIPFAILGPTIGGFGENIKNEISSTFGKAALITVRDDFSYSEALQWNKKIDVVPDIALSKWLPEVNKKIDLGVVFTNNNASFRLKFAQSIKEFIKDNKIDDPCINLYLTRRWKYDLRCAIDLQNILQKEGVASNLVMPSNFQELEIGLASCRMVISENLHGLILAARNLVPVVAVNDYVVGSPNYKKFIAFLSQAGSDKLFFNAENSLEDILFVMKEAWAGGVEKKIILDELRDKVNEKYEDVFSQLKKLITVGKN